SKSPAPPPPIRRGRARVRAPVLLIEESVMAKRTHQGSIAAFLVLALLAAAPLWAQSTATLQGTVTDAQGAVVPGAQVTAVNEATAVQRTATSDSAGYYQMAALPVGSYRVETRLSGFQPKVVKDVRLEVAHTVVLNIQLSLGNVSEEVAVTAEAPVIETATTSRSEEHTSELQ